MIRPLRLVALSALAALTAMSWAACAVVTVNSYSHRTFDVGRYHTYAWGPADPVSTGDPRLDHNPFFERRVREQVDHQLARRGFEQTTAAPDLLVHYHASVTQKMDTRELDRDTAPCESRDCRPAVYDAGTLVVDLMDPRTDVLLWRGWAEGSVDGVIDNQAWLESRIDDAVRRILRRLPPAGHDRGDER
jgi:hypothetical protein